MYQNMYQNFGMTPRTNEGTLIRVTGIEGARAYQMLPNSTVALFDGCEDIMYIKNTDGAGFPAIRLFRFEELKQETAQEVKQDYISRQEFEDFKKEVLDNGKQSIQRKSAASNKSTDN